MKTKEELESEYNLLKGKYKRVNTLNVPLNAEDVDDESEILYATIYLRKMDRTTYSILGKLAAGNDSLRPVEAVLNSLYIGGDDLKLVVENDDALMSCDGAIVKLIEKKSASLKKN